MKKLTALVEMDNKTMLIEDSTFKTKRDFKYELKLNGFKVIGIFTDEDLRAREQGYTSALAMKKVQGGF